MSVLVGNEGLFFPACLQELDSYTERGASVGQEIGADTAKSKTYSDFAAAQRLILLDAVRTAYPTTEAAECSDRPFEANGM